MSRARDLGDVGSKANFLDNVSTDLGDYSGQSIPHIIPDVLYPAVEGKDLAGDTLPGSYVYGTAHTDNRKYYYTDIKGSKPIKDPRIGGHFGSQRHHLGSVQLLEDETATHGEDVASVDGRSWIRTVGSLTSGSGVTFQNDQNGCRLELMSTNSFIEITGYFSDLNYGTFTGANRTIKYSLDGASESSDIGATSVNTPLTGRYINPSSFVNLGLGATLGIHTIKLRRTGSSGNNIYDIELIAQDTTSTANRSKIQIPSQDVVSYGKKFTVSGTPHYDPFNGFTSGSSVSSYIDTDTSLGVEKWKHSSTYYRPYNGGRVVKWVDSSGVIKTSVTLMPPNARALGDQANSAKANASVANNTYLPTFEAGDVTDDQGLSEVAKTFHYREFGNGNANGGPHTGSENPPYADASMLTGSVDDIAYVMDDGLTSLAGDDVTDSSNNIFPNAPNDLIYLTFIGTGIHHKSTHSSYSHNSLIAQNLPYGTHVIQLKRDGNSHPQIRIDGVYITASGGDDNAINSYGNFDEVTFYQPKKPPIPEDACVLADYMLMADFVKQSGTGSDIRGQISKGVRTVSGSRDVFCDDTGSRAFHSDAYDSVFISTSVPMGLVTFASHASTKTSSAQLEFFGTDAVVRVQGSDETHIIDFGGSTDVAKTALDNTSEENGDVFTLDNSATLGSNTVKTTVKEGGYWFFGYDVATPIHTSSHYQSFESPFLHELVGGDRNMEQTNLVVSPDGKTWDEITRDTSYLSNVVISASRDGGDVTGGTDYIWDYHRGSSNIKNYFNKQFAIAYDRFICLEKGFYEINVQIRGATAGQHLTGFIRVNGTNENFMDTTSASGEKGVLHGSLTVFLKRGDYFDLYRYAGDLEGGTNAESHLIVKRV